MRSQNSRMARSCAGKSTCVSTLSKAIESTSRPGEENHILSEGREFRQMSERGSLLRRQSLISGVGREMALQECARFERRRNLDLGRESAEVLSVRDGYAAWAACYEDDGNPLIPLE